MMNLMSAIVATVDYNKTPKRDENTNARVIGMG
jgi:hypothetical protein